MTLEQAILQVYHAGPLTVVGFGGQELLDRINVTECRDEILALVREHGCTAMAFDLTGVRLMPSGMLGLLASLRQLDIEVHLYNPVEDIREVLEITKLDRVLQVHELDV